MSERVEIEQEVNISLNVIESVLRKDSLFS